MDDGRLGDDGAVDDGRLGDDGDVADGPALWSNRPSPETEERSLRNEILDLPHSEAKLAFSE